MLIEIDEARQGLFGVQKNRSNVIEKKEKNCQRLLDTNKTPYIMVYQEEMCYTEKKDFGGAL